MPLPCRLLSVPPVTVMSASVKSVVASLVVKVMVAVWPSLRAVLSLVMAMVGGVMSVVLVAMVTLLLTSSPSVLKLPLASRNLRLPTEMTLLMVLLALGV